jgi:HK97 family phage portal protein
MNLFQRARLAGRLVVNDVISTSYELARYLFGGSDQAYAISDTGLPVTRETAMRLAAVYACVRVISEDRATLPLIMYERQARGRARVADHWMVDLIRQPNQFQTGFEFREMEQAHLELSGNFFALKTVVRGEVRELLPLAPGRISIDLENSWRLKIMLTWPDGTQDEIPPEKLYHQKGLSLNGYLGINPIEYQRETIGFGQALSKYGSRMFKHGANISGVIQHPQVLTEPAAKRLKESFEEKYSGLDNSGKMVLLEEGATFTKTGMNADDAQFLESRKYSRSEIAGIYRVPLHFIGDLERATFSNIEQQSLDYVQKGMLPRVRRIESRMNVSLLSKDDQKKFYVEHLLDGLLRGDYATRMRGYQTAILTGWMTRNEARELDNMNAGPVELDEFLVPMNMQQADKINENNDKQDPPADPKNPPPPEKK